MLQRDIRVDQVEGPTLQILKPRIDADHFVEMRGQRPRQASHAAAEIESAAAADLDV